MTGYALYKQIDKTGEVTCEIKSVNHRFMEVTTKPNDLNSKLDIFIRNTLQNKIQRGALDVRFGFNHSPTYSYSINRKSMQNLQKVLKDFSIINSDSISLSDIRNFPGIFETRQDNKISDITLKKVFLNAFKEFKENRLEEGKRVQVVFEKKIQKMLTTKKKLLSAIPAINKKRISALSTKVKQLEVNLDIDKLHQEAAILILKHDVAEELERIEFHLIALSKELASKQAKGKKIDFILQELFRETSTLSVKLDKPILKDLALGMKLTVEEMREQAQNIE
tara:strand:- start:6112 stop:6951 length:840 start_codon:yes stop_codon:yes gene_type:complete